MKVKLEDVERFERHVKMRLAFRFGVITVTDATQAVIRVRISLPDGRTSHGVAAEALAAKWFEKSPAFTDEQNLDQLRQSLDLAIELYRGAGLRHDRSICSPAPTPSSRSAAPRSASIRWWRRIGPALLDRAILDALGRATGPVLRPHDRAQRPRHPHDRSLTPDIADADLGPFLAGLEPAPSIEVRHTVGLVDPLTAADRPAAERVNDGLPETLEEVVSYYRGRYYKLKVGGDIKADLDRLSRIAAVLDAGAGDYRATLDGNEQYDDVEGIVELWRKVARDAGAGRLVQVDPVHRAADQARGGAQRARSSRWPGTAPSSSTNRTASCRPSRRR